MSRTVNSVLLLKLNVCTVQAQILLPVLSASLFGFTQLA